MNILVGVISRFEAWVMPRAFVDRLRADFPAHVFFEAWDADAVRRQLPQADVAFTPFIDPDIFHSLHRLRWVQSPAAGVDMLLFPEMIANDIVITSARGIRARPIAEHVIGVTIALARQFPAALRLQAAHEWGQNALEGRTTSIVSLRGKRMGIVGLGSIGIEIARLAAAFGMRVSGIRRTIGGTLPEGVEQILPPDRLTDLLSESDVVVLAAPTTSTTTQLVGEREIAAMKPGAFLINIGRGSLVVDEALVAALRAGHLGGAALDVFTHEPLDAHSPYWDLPNVIVTPHTSGAMRDYWTPLVALFSENLRRFERGDALLNVVDKTAGY